MAYEVTASKRRPQKFSELVGQEFVASTLSKSIKSGKIAHAYLFSGPRGCGKTSTARILAKVLNCTAGPDKAPCGECTPCKEIAKGTSLDVIEIDGASNTSVNDVRQIKDEVLFPPNSSKYKIYIIDEVHMLSTSAFNALLKTIEEPPPYVIFIFATTELHKVPATIKSRCQQYHFRLGSVEQIKNLLAKAAEEAGITAEDEALYWIAKEATGSFRDAYTLFDQVAAFSDTHITYDKIRDKLGILGTDQLNNLAEACCKGDSQTALLMIEDFIQAGIPIEQLITNISDYLRSILFIQSGIKKEGILGQNPERFSKLVLSTWTPVQIERALSMFLQLYRDIRYSLDVRYELDLAITKLCWLKSYVSNGEVKAAIDGAKNLLASDNAKLTCASDNSHTQGSTHTEPASTGNTYNHGSSTGIPAGLHRFSQLDNIQGSPPDTSAFHQSGNDSPVGNFSERGTPDVNQTRTEPSGGASGSSGEAPFSSGAPVFHPDFTQGPDHSFQGPGHNGNGPEEGRPFPDGNSENSGLSTDSQIKPDPSLSLQDVKAKVIDKEKELRNSFVATSLASTPAWQIVGNDLIIPVGNALTEEKIREHIPQIAHYIQAIWGKSLNIRTQLFAEKQEDDMANAPEAVKVVCDVFGGDIVSVQDIKDEPEAEGGVEQEGSLSSEGALYLNPDSDEDLEEDSDDSDDFEDDD